jgi:hypothetical protein
MWKREKPVFFREKAEKIPRKFLFRRHFVGMTRLFFTNVVDLSPECRGLSEEIRTGMTNCGGYGKKFSTGCGKVCGKKRSVCGES